MGPGGDLRSPGGVSEGILGDLRGPGEVLGDLRGPGSSKRSPGGSLRLWGDPERSLGMEGVVLRGLWRGL